MSHLQALCALAVLGTTFVSAMAEIRRGGPVNADELSAVIYGETAGLRPVLKVAGGSKNSSSMDPESARQLALARQWIGQVALNRGKRGGVADPAYLNRRERRLPEAVQVWRSCKQAALSAMGSGDPTGRALHYMLRKGGTPEAGGLPRRPGWAKGYAPSRSFGPFRCVGGGDVPAGDNIYIDFFDDIPL